MPQDRATREAATEIAAYEPRYGPFMEEIRRDLRELADLGYMTRARELSRESGQAFVDFDYPAYFFGDLDASCVLVHLNPLYTPDTLRFDGRPGPCSFKEHFDLHRHFGRHRYGPHSPRTHRSRFDHKQIRFLEPFGVIDFVDGDKFTNLEMVVDRKLQIELIPYGSPSFSDRGLTPALLAPHFDRIMKVLLASPRELILFCGAIFEKLLDPSWITTQHRFRLTKADGNPERSESRFANLEIAWNGTSIRAGLAQSWARQGIPMRAYAMDVQQRY